MPLNTLKKQDKTQQSLNLFASIEPRSRWHSFGEQHLWCWMPAFTWARVPNCWHDFRIVQSELLGLSNFLFFCEECGSGKIEEKSQRSVGRGSLDRTESSGGQKWGLNISLGLQIMKIKVLRRLENESPRFWLELCLVAVAGMCDRIRAIFVPVTWRLLPQRLLASQLGITAGANSAPVAWEGADSHSAFAC